MGQADADAGGVEGTGGDHEADTVKDPVGARRQLSAVGVTVEDGEEADQARRDSRLRPRLAEHCEPQDDGRQGDAQLDARERHPQEP